MPACRRKAFFPHRVGRWARPKNVIDLQRGGIVSADDKILQRGGRQADEMDRDETHEREAAALPRDEARAQRRAERRRRMRDAVFDTSVASPCIAVCQMDADNRYCIGCRRSVDEIRDWMIMTAAEKQAVLAKLDGR